MAKCINITIDPDLIRRIIDAGGILYREGSSWRIGTTKEIIRGREVRVLNAMGVLLGKRSNGILSINPNRIQRKINEQVKMIGNPIVYRDCRYNWQSYYGGKTKSRYVRGTVIATRNTTTIGQHLLVIHSGFPEIITVTRPHDKAPWKCSYAESLGVYAPGRPKHDLNIWERILAVKMLPDGWDAAPLGDPHTFARLRDVKRLLDMIGAPPVTAEERIASDIFCLSPERLEDIRGRVVWKKRDAAQYPNSLNSAMIEYLDSLLVRESEVIEIAEIKAVRYFIGMLHRYRTPIKIPTLNELHKELNKSYLYYSDAAIEKGHAEAIRAYEEIEKRLSEFRSKRETKQ
jgi:hypothetical protein